MRIARIAAEQRAAFGQKLAQMLLKPPNFAVRPAPEFRRIENDPVIASAAPQLALQSVDRREHIRGKIVNPPEFHVCQSKATLAAPTSGRAGFARASVCVVHLERRYHLRRSQERRNAG